MKKSELQQIIKEEIQNVLNEIDPVQQGFDAAMKKAGVELSTGGGNIMRPKLIDIRFDINGRYYKTLVDGKRLNQKDAENLIKLLTKIDIGLGRMDEENLNQISKILKSKNIDLIWDDSFDPF